MCQPGVTSFDRCQNITVDDSVSGFEVCECFIKGEMLSISIAGLKLSDSGGNNCTAMELMIESKIYKCSSELDDLGAVFGKLVVSQTNRSYFAITNTAKNQLPTMVLLEACTEGKCQYFHKHMNINAVLKGCIKQTLL